MTYRPIQYSAKAMIVEVPCQAFEIDDQPGSGGIKSTLSIVMRLDSASRGIEILRAIARRVQE
jgi:hypothetical protein